MQREGLTSLWWFVDPTNWWVAFASTRVGHHTRVKGYDFRRDWERSRGVCDVAPKTNVVQIRQLNQYCAEIQRAQSSKNANISQSKPLVAFGCRWMSLQSQDSVERTQDSVRKTHNLATRTQDWARKTQDWVRKTQNSVRRTQDWASQTRVLVRKTQDAVSRTQEWANTLRIQTERHKFSQKDSGLSQ